MLNQTFVTSSTSNILGVFKSNFAVYNGLATTMSRGRRMRGNSDGVREGGVLLVATQYREEGAKIIA
jgi:hypothetical protein